MKLYLQFYEPNGYWLSATAEGVDDSPVIYFRTGHTSLFCDRPTWFASKAEAVNAATLMCFTVEDTTGWMADLAGSAA